MNITVPTAYTVMHIGKGLGSEDSLAGLTQDEKARTYESCNIELREHHLLHGLSNHIQALVDSPFCNAVHVPGENPSRD